MSKLLLDKLNEELSFMVNEDIETYRSSLNKVTHIFSVSKQGIVDAILAELAKRRRAKRLDSISIAQRVQIRKIASTAADGILKSMKRYLGNAEKFPQKTVDANGRVVTGPPEINENASGFDFVVTIPSPQLAKIWDWQVKKMDEATIYSTLRQSFKYQRAKLSAELNQVLGEGAITGQFLNVGHAEGSAVITHKVRQSVSGVRQAAKAAGWTPEELRHLFGPTKIFLSMVSTEHETVVSASIESALLNQARGSTSEKELSIEWQKALRKAIKKLDSVKKWADRPGSDSRITIERKKFIKTFTKSVTRRKNVKVTSKDANIKYSDSKSKKEVKPKVTKVSAPKKHKVRVPKAELDTIKSSPVSGSVINLTALLAQINIRLPGKIRENMTPPALQFRTGRFASSVRATDIVQTPKGFPSIGYTYMKYPYQTFEPGFRQGSVERDPRSLIDRSIREVAAELLKGRLYTRRI